VKAVIVDAFGPFEVAQNCTVADPLPGSGEVCITVKAIYLLVKNISLSGLQWSDYRGRTLGWIADVQAQLSGPFRQGEVTPFIS